MGPYCLMLVALSVIMTLTANLARFGVIAPILVHAANNTAGRYLGGLLENTQPGTGGFLTWLGALMATHGMSRNITISIGSLLAISTCAGAVLLLAVTKGQLGYAKDRTSLSLTANAT